MTGRRASPIAKDFSERDRLALNLLRPHLVAIHRGLLATATLRRELAKANSIIEEIGRGVIAIAQDGAIEFANARAWWTLSALFGGRQRRVDALPEALARWVRETTGDSVTLRRPRRPFLLRRGEAQLSVHLIKNTGEVLLVIDDRSEAADRERLGALGLTPREVDVLFWVARGKTDADISALLY